MKVEIKRCFKPFTVGFTPPVANTTKKGQGLFILSSVAERSLRVDNRRQM